MYDGNPGGKSIGVRVSARFELTGFDFISDSLLRLSKDRFINMFRFVVGLSGVPNGAAPQIIRSSG